MVVPSNPYDAKGLLVSAIEDPDPVVFLEPARIYRAFKAEVPEEMYRIPLGKANIVREGTDVTLISWGAMMRVALEAARQLEQEKCWSCEVIDLRSLYPLDRDAIAASVKKTGRAIIVHEAQKTAGVGAEIVSLINDEALMYLRAPIQRITGFDVPVPQFSLEDVYVPTVGRVREGIAAAIQF